jgi:hypothetical protein
MASPHHRRARTALGWALLCFAAFQAATALALERLLPSVRDCEYGDKLTRLLALREQAPDRPLVLLLGSSRSLMCFQADRVQARWDGRDVQAFNFGLRGAGPMLQLVVLRRLLADGIQPDLLLLEVLPPLLNQPGDRPLEEEWLQGSRLRVSELQRVSRYHSHPPRLVRQWLKMRWAPCGFYGRELRGWLADGVPEPPPPPGELVVAGPLDAHGWQPYFPDGLTSEKRKRFWEVARAQYGPTFGEYCLASEPARALEDLLDLCDRRGVRVAFVLMPEGSEFRALYPEAMRAGLESYLGELSQRRRIPIVDGRQWVDDAGFWDAHHATPAGALAFTERFNHQGLPPLLATLAARPSKERLALVR